ncbi:MAG: hypothetical protein JJU29_14210 [Verrucomicrobia bacterium]|nr:hypothetical protein [Verrucomicrobiota bacterium]MCH8513326.1 hypothetical protein [Kiritimatiellia bacterium]
MKKIIIIPFIVLVLFIFSFIYRSPQEKPGNDTTSDVPAEATEILSVKVPMAPDFDVMVGKVENKILHNEEPNTFSVDYGDGLFETFSMRTTFWLTDGVVTMISFLPLAEPLPYQEVFHHIETLFLDHDITISDHLDENRAKRWKALKNSNAPGRETAFVPGIRRVRFELSDSVNVMLEIRQGPIQGWIYTLSFTTYPMYIRGNVRGILKLAERSREEWHPVGMRVRVGF